MHSKQEGLAGGLSRRAMLAVGTGCLASLACGIDPLPGHRPLLARRWDEIVPSLAGGTAQEKQVQNIPQRLRNPVRHDALAQAEWSEFRRRFVNGDGRVVDNSNGGISHSEGQGWGMLLSVAFDDLASFELLADWTKRNLQVRNDALHAWRYVPQSPMPVSDHNNASDGDLFIAAALWRAAWRWNRQDFATAARDIADSILAHLVRDVGGRTVLLPGAVGFERARTVTVNPSYYILPIFEELAALRPSPVWSRLQAHGSELLRDGRFGPWRLPPDWLQLDRDSGVLSPDPQRAPRFSYDAIRVPLWLAWAGGQCEAMRDFVAYWQRQQPLPPAWIDLSNNVRAAYPAPPGMLAIGHVASEMLQCGQKVSMSQVLPAVSASPDYYSAALTLLARCVGVEAHVA
jgi:endoglucanase